ncbi:MAG: hypothetical protein CTY39_12310, partial [Hyphomicrobium sp.]
LLPLRDARGRGFPEAKYDGVAAKLTDRFGGVTAYTRTPAEGRWKPGIEAPSMEDVVVFEVMVEALDGKWWRAYRKSLEKSFRQKSIIVRSQDIQLL